MPSASPGPLPPTTCTGLHRAAPACTALQRCNAVAPRMPLTVQAKVAAPALHCTALLCSATFTLSALCRRRHVWRSPAPDAAATVWCMCVPLSSLSGLVKVPAPCLVQMFWWLWGSPGIGSGALGAEQWTLGPRIWTPRPLGAWNIQPSRHDLLAFGRQTDRLMPSI